MLSVGDGSVYKSAEGKNVLFERSLHHSAPLSLCMNIKGLICSAYTLDREVFGRRPPKRGLLQPKPNHTRRPIAQDTYPVVVHL